MTMQTQVKLEKKILAPGWLKFEDATRVNLFGDRHLVSNPTVLVHLINSYVLSCKV